MALEARITPIPREPAPEPAALPSVLAVVVTHEGRRWLKDCLVALDQQTYRDIDVLLVDDASSKPEGAPALHRIAKRHLKRRRWAFLRTPRSLGFGGAINWALSRVKVNSDALLFIHDDAALAPDAVARMVARMLEDDATAIVGPKVVAWDDESRLEEIGMAADRFGYPYKGLEDDEIDLGQHDLAKEVFYVTSTCMLVKHYIFRELKGWDARMRAFSEDLDLCWRARLLGYSISVEPAAKARHAIALARGERASRFRPTRYYIRRNRFRTLTKNVSGARVALLIPQILFLTSVEMVGFIVLRQPREILNLFRALGWNLVNLLQTIAERRGVQATRVIPDRRLRRFTVRESTRVRAYVEHQADRLEQAWGRGSEALARRRDALRAVSSRTVGIAVAIGVIALLAFAVGFRHFLWGPQVAVAELLPYPDRATALLRAWASPWQAVGLGQPGPASPALALLGIVPIVTLGAATAAQKFLVLGLGAIAFLGAYHVIGEVVDRRARLVSGLVYGLGAVGYAAVRDGDLGAMLFGAAAPFVLHSLIRLTGWVRPAGWNRNRAIARVALGAAVSASLVPGALVFYLLAAVLLAVFRMEVDTGTHPVRLRVPDARSKGPRDPGASARRSTGLLAAIFGLVLAWALLLPWSASWFSPGGAFEYLLAAPTWERFAANYTGTGMGSVLLGQTPDVPPLLGLALPLLGVVALVTAEGQRRRLALAFWGIIAMSGVIMAATAGGAMRPVVSTPTDAGVLAAVAFAGLAGIAAAAWRMDLPRRPRGFIHTFSAGAIALSVLLAVVGLAPAIVRGEWAPGRGEGGGDPVSAAEVRSIFAAESSETGQFRALWVGEKWASGRPTVARPDADTFVTGARGHVLSDLFENDRGTGDAELEQVIASVRDGSTDRAGRLLAGFNVRFVVLERGPGVHRWLNQRDLALVREKPGYILLENSDDLARAAVFNELPLYVRALARGNPALSSEGSQVERVELAQRAPWSYEAPLATGPGTVFLAESEHPRWVARLEGQGLERTDGGWGNAFELPTADEGRLVVQMPRTLSEILWLIIMPLAWIVVIGASFSRRRGELDAR